MNFERLLDHVNEQTESYGAYHLASIQYKKKHGYGCYMDLGRGMDEDKQKVYHAYETDREEWYKLIAILEVLDYDSEQSDRLYKAARALRRWYNRTEWQYCPSRDLIDRLEKWVVG